MPSNVGATGAEFVTLAEIAQEWRLSGPSAASRLCRTIGVPVIKAGHRTRRVRRADLEAATARLAGDISLGDHAGHVRRELCRIAEQTARFDTAPSATPWLGSTLDWLAQLEDADRHEGDQ